jgi:glycosyltransferase involved in cell wall biosynthesis
LSAGTPQGAAQAPIKVLFYTAYPQRMAGGNRSMFELVTNLPDSVKATVLIGGEGEVADAYRAAGVPCRIVPAPGALGSFGKSALSGGPLRLLRTTLMDVAPFVGRLRRIIAEERPDIVHLNDLRGALTAAPAARLAGVPVILHLRGEIPFAGTLRWFMERAPHRIIAVSEGVRNSLTPAAKARTVTIYNGTRDISGRGEAPLPELEALRKKGVAVVACFASVVPFKGHHHLIRAVGALNRRGWRDKAAFFCIGDLVPEHAPYQAWLEALIAEEGAQNLSFTGWRPDPFPYYRNADITVLPSVTIEKVHYAGADHVVHGNEGFPRTHLEAMSFSLPVVGTRIAGVPEQVADGVTGLLVEPGDEQGLADALETLLKSPELRQDMGQKGRERVERLFSTDAYVAGVTEVYRDLLGSRKKGR